MLLSAFSLSSSYRILYFIYIPYSTSLSLPFIPVVKEGGGGGGRIEPVWDAWRKRHPGCGFGSEGMEGGGTARVKNLWREEWVGKEHRREGRKDIVFWYLHLLIFAFSLLFLISFPPPSISPTYGMFSLFSLPTPYFQRRLISLFSLTHYLSIHGVISIKKY